MGTIKMYLSLCRNGISLGRSRCAEAICNVLRSVWFMPCARSRSLAGWLAGSLTPCLCAPHEMQIKFLSMQLEPVDLRCSCDDWWIVLFACCSTKGANMQRPRSTALNCICQTVPLHFPPEKTTKEMEINMNCHRDVAMKTIICNSVILHDIYDGGNSSPAVWMME
jgi:hypothetical protein